MGDASDSGLFVEGRVDNEAAEISGDAVETESRGRTAKSGSDCLGDAVTPPAVVVVLVASFSSS